MGLADILRGANDHGQKVQREQRAKELERKADRAGAAGDQREWKRCTDAARRVRRGE